MSTTLTNMDITTKSCTRKSVCDAVVKYAVEGAITTCGDVDPAVAAMLQPAHNNKESVNLKGKIDGERVDLNLDIYSKEVKLNGKIGDHEIDLEAEE